MFFVNVIYISLPKRKKNLKNCGAAASMVDVYD